MVKRALLIGCNYRGSDCPLDGCWQDVVNMRDVLKLQGYDLANIWLRTDETEDLSALNIEALITRWIATVGPTDVLFFHFSGHGGQLPDTNRDEVDRRDECIYGSDLNEIVDDRLYQLLIAPLGIGNRLTIIGDCCHSGSGFDLPYRYLSSFAVQENRNKPNAKVMAFSGCRDEQTSADAFIEGKSQGALTALWIRSYNTLARARKGKTLPARGRVTYQALLAETQAQLRKEHYSQIPQLSFSHPGSVTDRVEL